jgi:hypothetical protein
MEQHRGALFAGELINSTEMTVMHFVRKPARPGGNFASSYAENIADEWLKVEETRCAMLICRAGAKTDG